MRNLRTQVWCVATLVVFACAGDRAAFAQTNVEVNQGIQIDYLNPGARSLAMGGAFVGLADDATAALANPAGLRALSKSEISFEGRMREFKNPFVFGGRLSGSVSGIGIDTVTSPILNTASSTLATPSFISGVYASAKHSWAIAAFRHQSIDYSTSFRTSGAFEQSHVNPNGSFRYYPVIADSSLKVANYGAAISKKWQSCQRVGTARSCEDRVAIGGGVSYYTFSIDSTVSRFNFDPRILTAPGFFYGSPQYSNMRNVQTQAGDSTGVGFNVGALLTPSRRFQVGVSYRRGVKFDLTASNQVPGEPTDPDYVRSAQFNLPDVVSAGAAVRLSANTVVLVDYSRVSFSQLMRGFVDVFSGPNDVLTADDEPVSAFSVADSNQIHLGFEHQFTSVVGAPAIRFGSWFDPDHAVRSTYVGSLFLHGEDVWHYTGGFGMLLKRIEFSAGADFSKRGNIASASAVVRF